MGYFSQKELLESNLVREIKSLNSEAQKIIYDYVRKKFYENIENPNYEPKTSKSGPKRVCRKFKRVLKDKYKR